MLIKDEEDHERDAIGAVVDAAFAGTDHSGGNEAAIVDALRRAGALAVSLLAVKDGLVIGHVALSPVVIDPGAAGAASTGDWYGLGPIAVHPRMQAKGIGSALVRAGLDRLRARGAAGCVVLGEPDFYRRFGFAADPGLRLAGVPPRYFQALAFGGRVPRGTVAYHPAFEA